MSDHTLDIAALVLRAARRGYGADAQADIRQLALEVTRLRTREDFAPLRAALAAVRERPAG